VITSRSSMGEWVMHKIRHYLNCIGSPLLAWTGGRNHHQRVRSLALPAGLGRRLAQQPFNTQTLMEASTLTRPRSLTCNPATGTPRAAASSRRFVRLAGPSTIVWS